MIAEIGSRDAIDGIELAHHFDASVVIFEPDPINSELCKRNLTLHGKQIAAKFFNIALSDESGLVDFYSVDPNVYSNRGSSSLHEINFGSRPIRDPDRNRATVQKKVRVQVSRFDDLGLAVPDLIAMDVEGAELKVLLGFGDQLRDVKAVLAETSFWNNFHGPDSTFPKVHFLLAKMDFRFVASSRNGPSSKFPRQSFRRLLFPRYQPAFDVLYINKSYESKSP